MSAACHVTPAINCFEYRRFRADSREKRFGAHLLLLVLLLDHRDVRLSLLGLQRVLHRHGSHLVLLPPSLLLLGTKLHL